jgi:LPXTG-motif cell wall-anchored protein
VTIIAKARGRQLLAVVVVLVAGWAAAAAQPALAHIQIRPTAAAPGDSVLFELLVPGEREARTVEVALQMPKGVLPFSFEKTPGWPRKLELANDGSIDVVRWRGRLDTDGFVRFAFLAGAPEREGQLEWKALQTYDDGHEARWIGPPDSENPAAVTSITDSATRENAGGEGAAAPGEGANPPEEDPTATDEGATGASTDQQPATDTASGDDGNTAALLLGAAGVVLGATALFVALRRRRPQRPALRQDPG